MPLKSPIDLLTLELKEIHSAERQLSRALPRIARNVSSQRLCEMLERRREQGSQLIEGIDEALEEIGTTKARKKNVAIEGLIEDVNQHADEIQDERMLQAAVLASVQKIEHYCIAAWGTAKSMGRLLDQQKVVEVMERALEEGKQFDKEMTQLAEEEINVAMLTEEEEEEEETTEEGEEETAEQDQEGGGEGQEEQSGARTSSRKKQGGGGRRKSAA
jgi:ferritin-like metal-binding protein YciE